MTLDPVDRILCIRQVMHSRRDWLHDLYWAVHRQHGGDIAESVVVAILENGKHKRLTVPTVSELVAAEKHRIRQDLKKARDSGRLPYQPTAG